MQRLLIALIVLSFVAVACNRGADEATTTTTTAQDQPVTRTTSGEPTDAISDDTREPSEADEGDEVGEGPAAELPSYSIVRREGAEGGDRLVVLLEDFQYTDLVLEDLVFEIAEEYSPVLEAYLIDDPAASDLVLLDPESWSDEDRTVVEDHLFVSLTEGNLVTFRGPFADMGEFRMGS